MVAIAGRGSRRGHDEGQERTNSVVAARSGDTTTFYATGPQGQVLTSTDGDHWEEIGMGFPGADGQPAFPGPDVVRVGLTVQRTNPGALGLGPRFVYNEVAPAEILPI